MRRALVIAAAVGLAAVLTACDPHTRPEGWSLTQSWYVDNTGVRTNPTEPCRRLDGTVHNGIMVAEDQGRTISNCRFYQSNLVFGQVEGNGIDKVRLTDVYIEGRVWLGWEALGGSTEWVLEYSTIDGTSLPDDSNAIGDDGFTMYRTEVYGASVGPIFSGNNAGKGNVVWESYIHDLFQRNDGAHRECIGTHGSTGPALTIIVGNYVDCSTDTGGLTAAIALLTDNTPIENILVEDNYFDGGGAIAYGGSVQNAQAHYCSSNVDWIDNRFGRVWNTVDFPSNPATSWSSNGGGEWTGNRFLDDGTLIPAPEISCP